MTASAQGLSVAPCQAMDQLSLIMETMGAQVLFLSNPFTLIF